jgi:hypothetical protein
VTAYLSDSNLIYLGPLYNQKMRCAPLLVGLHEPDIRAHKILRYGHRGARLSPATLTIVARIGMDDMGGNLSSGTSDRMIL